MARRELFTVEEVAARLKCHPHTVRRWIWSRRLPAVRVGDLVRVPEEEVERLVRPAEQERTKKQRPQPGKGVPALQAAMRALRRQVNPKDVTLLERKIAEGEKTADWSTPVA